MIDAFVGDVFIPASIKREFLLYIKKLCRARSCVRAGGGAAP